MRLSEYKSVRADLINKMIIPHTEFPQSIKFLWFDNINSAKKSISEDTKLHSHSFFELIFIVNGTVTYKIRDTLTKIKENSFILLPPNTPHAYHSGTPNYYKIVLAFLIDEKSELCEKLRATENIKAKYPRQMHDIFNFILRQSEEDDFFTPALISGKLLEILYLVLNSLNIKIPSNSSLHCDERVICAKEYIEKNPHRIVSGKEVATHCNLSLKQLNRLFASDVGITLYDYITRCKLKEAKKLLLDENQSIKEIAFSLGFESESSFSSFFKRHAGLSAGAFKKHCTLCRDNGIK